MSSRLRDDRGQILVIAALLIAVLFVGLALVLNSAIYAENIATRGETSTAETVSNDVVTQERLGEMLATENYGVENDSYSDRHARIETNVSEWDRLMGTSEARNGRLYHAEPTAMTNGTRVAQDEFGNFMPAKKSILDKVTKPLLPTFRIDPLGLGSKTNWIIANNVQVRGFEMTVTRDSLHDKQPDILDDLINLVDTVITGSDLFWVEVDKNAASDEYWRVYLLDKDNSSVEAIVVEYDDGSGTIRGRCDAAGDEVTVKLTEGELVGTDGVKPCPALIEATNGESQDIYYSGADEVFGKYHFIVDKPETVFREGLEDRYGTFLDSVLDVLVGLLLEPLGGSLNDEDIFHDSQTGDGPYTSTAIYDLSVETTYQDGRVSLTRNVTFPPTAR